MGAESISLYRRFLAPFLTHARQRPNSESLPVFVQGARFGVSPLLISLPSNDLVDHRPI